MAARHGRLATVALLAVAAAWGSTFFLTKDLLTRIDTYDYLAVRFLIAGIAMIAIAPRAMTKLTSTERARGIALGVVYGGAQIVQTKGLTLTAASVSGFITGLYVVLTPLLGWLLLRQQVGRWAWVAALLATTGLGVLSLRGFAIGPGELLTLASAGLYALHIIGLARWSRPSSAYAMACVQMLVITAVCTVAAGPGGIGLPHRAVDWVSLVYMAVVAGALALIAQTWAQAHLSPTRAAVAMATEPVFAALFAVLFGGESLTWRMLIGGCAVVAAMLLVETAPRPKPEAEPHLAT